MKILYEDKEIIVCCKEAGIAVQSARIGQQDMVSMLNNYLAGEACGYVENGVHTVENSPEKSESRGKGPNSTGGYAKARKGQEAVQIHVVHRLDQPVEGILVFAKTKRAASELGRQVSDGRMKKIYHAVCCMEKCPERKEDSITLVDYLVRDGRNNTSFVSDQNHKDAKRSVLACRILKTVDASVGRDASGDGKVYALAEINLGTGRHHQIRVQMSHAGMSLYGDRKYNTRWEEYVLPPGEDRTPDRRMEHGVQLALCASELSFVHPVSGKQMTFAIKPQGRIFDIFGDDNFRV